MSPELLSVIDKLESTGTARTLKDVNLLVQAFRTRFILGCHHTFCDFVVIGLWV